jgi:hypothetical protein
MQKWFGSEVLIEVVGCGWVSKFDLVNHSLMAHLLRR